MNISAFILDAVRDRPIQGSQLAQLIRAQYPDWSAEVCGARNLRDYVERLVDGAGVVGRSRRWMAGRTGGGTSAVSIRRLVSARSLSARACLPRGGGICTRSAKPSQPEKDQGPPLSRGALMWKVGLPTHNRRLHLAIARFTPVPSHLPAKAALLPTAKSSGPKPLPTSADCP